MSLEDIHIAQNYAKDEQQLWKSFLDGDLKAWEEIFKLFYKDLYGYALKLSTRPELTKDCIHELFVTLWERRKKLGEVNSIKAYLLASLRRKLLKKLRKKRKYYSGLDSKKKRSNAIEFSPEELVIRDEIKVSKRKALYDALDSLPDRQKEVLYLKYFNGMSYDEIEEILSINYQSIRNHIYRAMERLRVKLDKKKSKIVISLLPFLLFLSF